jgi:hypothetical protein
MIKFLEGLMLWIEATDNYVEKKVDPALMTWSEFWNKVNPENKFHSDHAYDAPLTSHAFSRTKKDYPELLYRKRISGIAFEFRYKKTDRFADQKFIKTDPDGRPIEIGGQYQYFTIEELIALDRKRYEYGFAVFHGEQQVAVTQDEWGCLLVMTAPEYRGFGLGSMITKLAWEVEPGKDTGGTSPGGYATVKKVYSQCVREYLRKGIYSQLVQKGILDVKRVKEITDSAQASSPSSQPAERPDLSSDDPRNYVLYGENGCFVLYDRKLKDIINQGDKMHFWAEKMVKGVCYAGGGYHATDKLYLHQWGGDTPKVKNFMLSLALTYCAEERLPLFIYKRDLPVDQSLVNVQSTDPNGDLVLGKTTVPYQSMVAQEKMFRRSFDKYDEFKSTMVEMAEAKFR